MTRSPTDTRVVRRYGKTYSTSASFFVPVASSISGRTRIIFSLPWFSTAVTTPVTEATTAGFRGRRFSKISSTRGRPAVMSPPCDAVPPAWNVRIVSCVPGSPIA